MLFPIVHLIPHFQDEFEYFLELFTEFHVIACRLDLQKFGLGVRVRVRVRAGVRVRVG
jgi:hypothetical protein